MIKSLEQNSYRGLLQYSTPYAKENISSNAFHLKDGIRLRSKRGSTALLSYSCWYVCTFIILRYMKNNTIQVSFVKYCRVLIKGTKIILSEVKGKESVECYLVVLKIQLVLVVWRWLVVDFALDHGTNQAKKRVRNLTVKKHVKDKLQILVITN